MEGGVQNTTLPRTSQNNNESKLTSPGQNATSQQKGMFRVPSRNTKNLQGDAALATMAARFDGGGSPSSSPKGQQLQRGAEASLKRGETLGAGGLSSGGQDHFSGQNLSESGQQLFRGNNTEADNGIKGRGNNSNFPDNTRGDGSSRNNEADRQLQTIEKNQKQAQAQPKLPLSVRAAIPHDTYLREFVNNGSAWTASKNAKNKKRTCRERMASIKTLTRANCVVLWLRTQMYTKTITDAVLAAFLLASVEGRTDNDASMERGLGVVTLVVCALPFLFIFTMLMRFHFADLKKKQRFWGRYEAVHATWWRGKLRGSFWFWLSKSICGVRVARKIRRFIRKNLLMSKSPSSSPEQSPTATTDSGGMGWTQKRSSRLQRDIEAEEEEGEMSAIVGGYNCGNSGEEGGANIVAVGGGTTPGPGGTTLEKNSSAGNTAAGNNINNINVNGENAGNINVNASALLGRGSTTAGALPLLESMPLASANLVDERNPGTPDALHSSGDEKGGSPDDVVEGNNAVVFSSENCNTTSTSAAAAGSGQQQSRHLRFGSIVMESAAVGDSNNQEDEESENEESKMNPYHKHRNRLSVASTGTSVAGGEGNNNTAAANAKHHVQFGGVASESVSHLGTSQVRFGETDDFGGLFDENENQLHIAGLSSTDALGDAGEQSTNYYAMSKNRRLSNGFWEGLVKVLAFVAAVLEVLIHCVRNGIKDFARLESRMMSEYLFEQPLDFQLYSYCQARMFSEVVLESFTSVVIQITWVIILAAQSAERGESHEELLRRREIVMLPISLCLSGLTLWLFFSNLEKSAKIQSGGNKLKHLSRLFQMMSGDTNHAPFGLIIRIAGSTTGKADMVHVTYTNFSPSAIGEIGVAAASSTCAVRHLSLRGVFNHGEWTEAGACFFQNELRHLHYAVAKAETEISGDDTTTSPGVNNTNSSTAGGSSPKIEEIEDEEGTGGPVKITVASSSSDNKNASSSALKSAALSSANTNSEALALNSSSTNKLASQKTSSTSARTGTSSEDEDRNNDAIRQAEELALAHGTTKHHVQHLPTLQELTSSEIGLKPIHLDLSGNAFVLPERKRNEWRAQILGWSVHAPEHLALPGVHEIPLSLLGSEISAKNSSDSNKRKVSRVSINGPARGRKIRKSRASLMQELSEKAQALAENDSSNDASSSGPGSPSAVGAQPGRRDSHKFGIGGPMNNNIVGGALSKFGGRDNTRKGSFDPSKNGVGGGAAGKNLMRQGTGAALGGVGVGGINNPNNSPGSQNRRKPAGSNSGFMGAQQVAPNKSSSELLSTANKSVFGTHSLGELLLEHGHFDFLRGCFDIDSLNGFLAGGGSANNAGEMNSTKNAPLALANAPHNNNVTGEKKKAKHRAPSLGMHALLLEDFFAGSVGTVDQIVAERFAVLRENARKEEEREAARIARREARNNGGRYTTAGVASIGGGRGGDADGGASNSLGVGGAGGNISSSQQSGDEDKSSSVKGPPGFNVGRRRSSQGLLSGSRGNGRATLTGIGTLLGTLGGMEFAEWEEDEEEEGDEDEEGEDNNSVPGGGLVDEENEEEEEDDRKNSRSVAKRGSSSTKEAKPPSLPALASSEIRVLHKVFARAGNAGGRRHSSVEDLSGKLAEALEEEGLGQGVVGNKMSGPLALEDRQSAAAPPTAGEMSRGEMSRSGSGTGDDVLATGTAGGERGTATSGTAARRSGKRKNSAPLVSGGSALSLREAVNSKEAVFAVSSTEAANANAKEKAVSSKEAVFSSSSEAAGREKLSEERVSKGEKATSEEEGGTSAAPFAGGAPASQTLGGAASSKCCEDPILVAPESPCPPSVGAELAAAEDLLRHNNASEKNVPNINAQASAGAFSMLSDCNLSVGRQSLPVPVPLVQTNSSKVTEKNREKESNYTGTNKDNKDYAPSQPSVLVRGPISGIPESCISQSNVDSVVPPQSEAVPGPSFSAHPGIPRDGTTEVETLGSGEVYAPDNLSGLAPNCGASAGGGTLITITGELPRGLLGGTSVGGESELGDPSGTREQKLPGQTDGSVSSADRIHGGGIRSEHTGPASEHTVLLAKLVSVPKISSGADGSYNKFNAGALENNTSGGNILYSGAGEENVAQQPGTTVVPPGTTVPGGENVVGGETKSSSVAENAHNANIINHPTPNNQGLNNAPGESTSQKNQNLLPAGNSNSSQQQNVRARASITFAQRIASNREYAEDEEEYSDSESPRKKKRSLSVLGRAAQAIGSLFGGDTSSRGAAAGGGPNTSISAVRAHSLAAPRTRSGRRRHSREVASDARGHGGANGGAAPGVPVRSLASEGTAAAVNYKNFSFAQHVNSLVNAPGRNFPKETLGPSSESRGVGHLLSEESASCVATSSAQQQQVGSNNISGSNVINIQAAAAAGLLGSSSSSPPGAGLQVVQGGGGNNYTTSRQVPGLTLPSPGNEGVNNMGHQWSASRSSEKSLSSSGQTLLSSEQGQNHPQGPHGSVTSGGGNNFGLSPLDTNIVNNIKPFVGNSNHTPVMISPGDGEPLINNRYHRRKLHQDHQQYQHREQSVADRSAPARHRPPPAASPLFRPQ